MRTKTMGRVLVAAKIQNLSDLYHANTGALKPEEVRTVEVQDALVDTGATMLSMPVSLIQQLGLTRHRTRRARTSAGVADFGVYEAVRLTVNDRDCVSEVAEVPEGCPVLIGQLPLEALDYLVDPVNQRLVGNPEHGGEQMIDMF